MASGDPIDRILVPGETCWRIERARRFAPLIDGAAYFAALHEALRTARSSLLMLAWDIDNRVALLRDGEAHEAPAELGKLLDHQAKKHPGLSVYVLCWDPSLFYALERRWLQPTWWQLMTHRRVTFRADDHHPFGAAHHQKVVVVDDAVAFVGGIDVTKHRWDTPAHRRDDARRRAPSGERYAPFHDVHGVVEGEVARALGELARRRFRHATAKIIAPPEEARGSRWPPSVAPWLEDVPVAILRTQPAHRAMRAVTEIARFNQRAIAAATRHIYLETQFLTARPVARALCRRLAEEHGPEVVIVVSHTSEGWLEHQTMDALRSEVVASLRQADRFGRLRVLTPRLAGEGPPLIVHSKVMIVDDRVLRIGSSNLSNRSLSLDTECDLALEWLGRDDIERAVRRLRHTLLAEHLDVPIETLAALEGEVASVAEAVDRLRAKPGRTLVPLEGAGPDDLVLGPPAFHLADPPEPVDADALLDELVPSHERRRLPRRMLALAFLVLTVILLTSAWHLTPIGDVGQRTLRAWLSTVAHRPAGAALATAVFAALTAFGLPVTVAIAVSVWALGSWLGFIVALSGCLLSALLSFVLGHWLGSEGVRRLSGPRFGALRRALKRRGILSVAVVRVLPIAPFAAVNLAAGAIGVRLRDFLIGTVVVMAPGILGMSVAIDRLVAALQSPTPVSTTIVLAIVLALAAAAVGLGRWAHRQLKSDHEPSP